MSSLPVVMLCLVAIAAVLIGVLFLAINEERQRTVREISDLCRDMAMCGEIGMEDAKKMIYAIRKRYGGKK